MYNNYGFNQYVPQQRFQPIDPMQTTNQMFNAMPISINKPLSLNGKIVESMEMVKATEIPMDGSISYFPQADNSIIYTKQLQNDGTTKIICYKPVKNEKNDAINFVTFDDLMDLQDEIKEIKKELNNIQAFKNRKKVDDKHE